MDWSSVLDTSFSSSKKSTTYYGVFCSVCLTCLHISRLCYLLKQKSDPSFAEQSVRNFFSCVVMASSTNSYNHIVLWLYLLVFWLLKSIKCSGWVYVACGATKTEEHFVCVVCQRNWWLGSLLFYLNKFKQLFCMCKMS